MTSASLLARSFLKARTMPQNKIKVFDLALFWILSVLIPLGILGLVFLSQSHGPHGHKGAIGFVFNPQLVLFCGYMYLNTAIRIEHKCRREELAAYSRWFYSLLGLSVLSYVGFGLLYDPIHSTLVAPEFVNEGFLNTYVMYLLVTYVGSIFICVSALMRMSTHLNRSKQFKTIAQYL